MSEITVKDIYPDAKIFTAAGEEESIERYSLAQIKMICDNPAAEGAVIRLMPDVHPGKIGPIGLTITVRDRIIPGLIGVDIGCGLTVAKLEKVRNEFDKLDSVIRESIPAGLKIRDKASRYADDFDYNRLICRKHIRSDKAILSMGTLGDGNQFIEVDRDDNNVAYLTIHTGSRHLGKERSQYMNKRDAFRKLSAVLKQMDASGYDKQRNDAWSKHAQFVRGNPVRVYKGIDFIKTKGV